jgi:hypothetical protein
MACANESPNCHPVPPNGRNWCRVLIAPNLYVLARRSRNGFVRRYFVARIMTDYRSDGIGRPSLKEPRAARLDNLMDDYAEALRELQV